MMEECRVRTPARKTESGISIKADVFAHEIGHSFGLAAEPYGYQQLQKDAGPEFDCQDPVNSNNPVALPALQIQKKYDELLKH